MRGIRAKEATEGKQVRRSADPGSIYQMRMTWTREGADCEEQWSFGTPRCCLNDCWEKDIAPALVEFERLTWAEIERQASGGHRKHHPMETEVIVEEAQNRLIEIERESDIIYRFRLGNKPRLWGQRVVSQFQIIWYDPDHLIYPVEKS